ncbi:hypothetical protein SteCoe_27002 [Stentor coeruleus]|uniref:Uncharacterized protein n=1 Tax=Stentor coeruleus TaxID=5963 RepID=A0A1R2BBM0_9CILI|nr:hypothetical protein SteCoe_27002 [Stentor coeruleus]
MYCDSNPKSKLHIWKDSIHDLNNSLENKSKLPSGELSIIKKGDKLCLRPLSPYRYICTPKINKDLCSDISESSVEIEPQCHQRSSTTIINDIAQSYTFIPAIKKTQESIHDEDSISNSSKDHSEDDYKNSILASTVDPKSFLRKPKLNQGQVSTILTISSTSSEKNAPKKLVSHRNYKRVNQEPRNSIFESVTAFCKKCGQNTVTEVIENIYVGTL